MTRFGRALATILAASALIGPGCAARQGRRTSKGPAPMADVGREIERLEREMDERGTVAIKQPDVWGQARLTAFRVEFEKQMASERGNFRQVIAGQSALSDQSAFQAQLSAGAVVASRSAAVASTSTSSSTATTAAPTADAQVGAADAALAGGSAIPGKVAIPGFSAAQAAVGDPIGIERTVYLDEEKRYLDDLAQIRRVNLGDDTSDSAGYGFYLARLPASILPGRATRAGHGASLALSIRPEFDPDFLPRTFRDLAVNDLVNLLTPILYNLLTTTGWEEALARYEAECSAGWKDLPPEERFARVHALMAELKEKVPAFGSAKTICPISQNDLPRVMLVENLARIARDARPRLAAEHVRASDVRNYLAKELRAAYDLMADHARPGVGLDDPAWIDALGAAIADRAFEGRRDEAPDHVDAGSFESNDLALLYPTLVATLPGNLRRRSLGALCWAVAVESTLLDRQIRDEIRRMAGSGRLDCPVVDALRFYRPRPGPEATAAFEDYVRARWPAVVFALDPVADQQNIADSHRLGRELQLASAFAVASGKLGGKQLTAYMRQVSRASDTVRLNRTIVAFAHGNDAFGWRFSPRFQNPAEPPGPLHALGQAAAGSIGHDPQSSARLEPGVRELSAAVLLPSFLPAVRLEASGDWFPIDDPGRSVFEAGWVLEEGRAIRSARSELALACDAGAYRPADVAGLSARLDRLEARLPMQSYQVRVPYQNTLGGFELFAPGSTALRPELTGFEGASAVDPRGGDVIFLMARNVDLGATRVIVGGRPAGEDHVEILSREVIRLALPPCARPVVDRGRLCVEVYLATPNGVSNRLAIPCTLPADVGPPEAGFDLPPPPPPGPGPFATVEPPKPAPPAAPAPSEPQKKEKSP